MLLFTMIMNTLIPKLSNSTLFQVVLRCVPTTVYPGYESWFFSCVTLGRFWPFWVSASSSETPRGSHTSPQRCGVNVLCWRVSTQACHGTEMKAKTLLFFSFLSFTDHFGNRISQVSVLHSPLRFLLRKKNLVRLRA